MDIVLGLFCDSFRTALKFVVVSTPPCPQPHPNLSQLFGCRGKTPQIPNKITGRAMRSAYPYCEQRCDAVPNERVSRLRVLLSRSVN